MSAIRLPPRGSVAGLAREAESLGAIGMMTPRLPLEASARDLELRGGHLRVWSPFFEVGEADRLLEGLWRDIEWSQHFVAIAGRRIASPRLSAWYGVDGAHYRYSGHRYDPLPFTPLLDEVRSRLNAEFGTSFNSVLANAYRDGADSMGWHSDDEPEVGTSPVIASVSLGETRRFRLRHRKRAVEPVALDLEHGSLLVMDGDTQANWHHAVPKTRRQVGLRVNLTFRWIRDLGDA